MQNKALAELMRTTRPRPGAKPAFHACDLLNAFWRIGSKTRIGRAQLSRELGLGEGSARTVLSRLRQLGWIATTKAGCSLSQKEKQAFEEFSNVVHWAGVVEPSGLTFSQPSFAVCVRACAQKVTSGVAQRDAALRWGATGATTLTFHNGRLRFPDGIVPSDLRGPIETLSTAIPSLSEGDCVLAGYSHSPQTAARGAWAGVLSLLGQ